MTTQEKEKILKENYSLIVFMVNKWSNCFCAYMSKEDYIQECLLNVFHYLDSYNSETAKLSTYIGIICNSTTLNLYHKKKKIEDVKTELKYENNIPDKNYNELDKVIDDIYINQLLRETFNDDRTYHIMYDKIFNHYSNADIAKKYNYKNGKSAGNATKRKLSKLTGFFIDY